VNYTTPVTQLSCYVPEAQLRGGKTSPVTFRIAYEAGDFPLITDKAAGAGRGC
jgi:hypothetical protein